MKFHPNSIENSIDNNNNTCGVSTSSKMNKSSTAAVTPSPLNNRQ